MNMEKQLPPQVNPKQRKQLHNGIRSHCAITIMAPLERVYAYWRNFNHFPLFMDQLESIRHISPRHSHWTWKALKGQRTVEWETEIIDEVENSHISWQTIGDFSVKHAGSVWFRELPYSRGTLVQVQMIYHVPGGKLTDTLEKILGENPEQNLRKDLRQLKELIESGTIPTVQGQARGGKKEESNPALH